MRMQFDGASDGTEVVAGRDIEGASSGPRDYQVGEEGWVPPRRHRHHRCRH